jgi:MFS family permease
MADDATRAEGEFKRGWPVVFAAAIGIGLGLSPLPFYTIGVFVGPLSQPIEAGGLGLSPAQIMLALPVYTIGALIMSPIIGFLADRVGVRRVAIVSIILFSLSLALLGLNTGSLPLFVATWAFMAVAGAGTLPITFTRAVNNWFFEKRGVALGMALIATGLYGALAKLLAQQVTSEFGWRAGYMAVALLPLLISLPVALVAFRDVRDKPAAEALTTRLKPLLMAIALACGFALAAAAFAFVIPQIQERGPRPELIIALVFAVLSILPLLGLAFGRISKSVAPTAAQGRAAGGDAGLTLVQALREWRFWVLAIAFVPISFALGGPIPNIELLLGSKNFGAAEAVGLAALVGVAVIVGRIVGGYLIDRFWAPGVAAIFLSAPAIALWLLGAPEMTREMAMIAIFLIGFGAGVEYDFMAYLVARYFGTRAYGAIYGSLYGFFAIGAGFGPPMFAAAVRSGPAAVESLMHVAMGVLIAGSVALLTLGRYRTFGAAPETAANVIARAETVEDVRPA